MRINKYSRRTFVVSVKLLIHKAIALCLALLVLTLPAATSTTQAAPLKRFNGYSYNWGGYALVVGGEVATSASGNKYWTGTSNNPILPYTVNYVYGEWTVPRTKAGVTGFIADTSVCVGIDGYDSNTVEQVGTSSTYDPSTGQTAYYAWWEMYPKFSHSINAMNVNPGDSISAYVQFTPEGNSQAVVDRGIFKLSVTDMTTGKSFTITQGPFKPDFYLRSSAEWIVERAAFSDRKTKQAYFAELAEFDTPITFTNCKSTVSTYGSNQIHYDRMWIRAPYTGGDYGDAYLTLGTAPNTIAKAGMRTGGLMQSGSFTITWVSYGISPISCPAWPCPDPEGSNSCPT
jgi:hypothetical protein